MRKSKILVNIQGFKDGLASFSSVGFGDLPKILVSHKCCHLTKWKVSISNFDVHDKKLIYKNLIFHILLIIEELSLQDVKMLENVAFVSEW